MEDLLADMAAAAAIAEQAGQNVESHRRQHGVTGLSDKAGPLDQVSDLDRVAEAVILRGISARWPKDGVLSEESGGVAGSGSRRWVVDPIDGTVNCVRGIGPWAIALCCVSDGQTVLSVVHTPTTGETFAAARGAGFYVNGKLRYNRADAERRRPDGPRLDAGVVETCIFDRSWVDSSPELSKVFARAKQSRVFNATLPALAFLADGRLDGCIGMKLAPWDWLPGALLVEESGGVVGETGFYVFAAGRGCADQIEACLRRPHASAV
jgi:myo-inositol-1(or 4)-monophosphatase